MNDFISEEMAVASELELVSKTVNPDAGEPTEVEFIQVEEDLEGEEVA